MENSITKKCTLCGNWKLVILFTKKHSKYGSWCKACQAERERERRKNNPEKVNASKKRWKENNRERVRENDARYQKEYYKKNLEKKREQGKKRSAKYKLLHPEKVLESMRRWHNLNPNSDKEWREKNPEKTQAKNFNRRARIQGNGGKITAKEWVALKETYDYTCLCCKRKEPEIKLTLDHVIPLKLGGRNVIENAQPLCCFCNSSKGAKEIDYR